MEHENDILIAEPAIENDCVTGDICENEKENSTQKTFENKTIKKETESFVNYKNNNLNKVFKKYDIIQTYVPQKQNKQKTDKEFETFATEQSSFVKEKETLSVEKIEDKKHFKMLSKTKVWIVAGVCICAMLSGLCIYNAVSIQSISDQIGDSISQIGDINKDIETIIKDIGKLTDENTVRDEAGNIGLSEMADGDKIKIKLNEKNIVKDYQSQTNFFDKVCNFFRNLFGG